MTSKATSKKALDAVRELHSPYDTPDDPHAARRCRGCIAGYDPRTGKLVHCAWPCPTIQVIDRVTTEHAA